MSYRKDSRMGDEIFSSAATVLPFVILLIKKVMSKVTKQKPIDPSLSGDRRAKLEKDNLSSKVKFWQGAGIFS